MDLGYVSSQSLWRWSLRDFPTEMMNQDISFCHRYCCQPVLRDLSSSLWVVRGCTYTMGWAWRRRKPMTWIDGQSYRLHSCMLKLYGSNSLIDIIPVVYRTRAITRVNRAAKDHQFCRGKKMTAAAQQRKRYDTIWFNPSSSSESDQICCNIVRLVYAAAADSLMFCVQSQTLFILQVIQYISTVDQSTSKTFECKQQWQEAFDWWYVYARPS